MKVFLGLGLLGGPPAWAADEPQAEEPAPDDQPSDDAPADDDAPLPPPTIILLAPPSLVPSALDDLGTLASEGKDATDPELKDLLLDLAGTRMRLPVRSTFYLRPRLALIGAEGASGPAFAAGLGATAGQRWWPLRQGAVQWGGENRLQAVGLAGRVKGYELAGVASLALWLGPIGLRAGPRLEVSRLVTPMDKLSGATLLGAETSLALEAGPLHPWVSMSPMVALGDKRVAGTGPLPTLGTETLWGAGVAVETGWLQPRIEGSLRTTGLGSVVTVLLGLQIRPRLDEAKVGGDLDSADDTDPSPDALEDP